MKPQNGTISYNRHVVTLPHNDQKVLDALSYAPLDITVLVFNAPSRDGEIINFKVCRQNVLQTLFWLKESENVYEIIALDINYIEQV